MNLSKLTRSEKENLYIQKMTDLQTLWGNPIDEDWSFVKESSDEYLEKGIEDTISQLRFEKAMNGLKQVVSLGFKIFVYLGLFGLLLFGIKQIF